MIRRWLYRSVGGLFVVPLSIGLLLALVTLPNGPPRYRLAYVLAGVA
jgi:hypothetical protein